MMHALRTNASQRHALLMWVIRQSLHLLSVPIHFADTAAEESFPPPSQFPLPQACLSMAQQLWPPWLQLGRHSAGA